MGIGRFRILGGGGARLRILGEPRGANSQQAHDVETINQCQIITFPIFKYDIIENSRLALRGIVLPGPSNQIKVTFIIILPFSLVHL